MNLSNSTPSLVTHDPFRATTSSNLGREESKGECFIQLTLKPAATGSPSSPPLINMLIFYYLKMVTLSKVSRGKLGQTSALHPIPARPSKADDVYCPVVLAPAPVNIAVSEILKPISLPSYWHIIKQVCVVPVSQHPAAACLHEPRRYSRCAALPGGQTRPHHQLPPAVLVQVVQNLFL